MRRWSVPTDETFALLRKGRTRMCAKQNGRVPVGEDYSGSRVDRRGGGTASNRHPHGRDRGLKGANVKSTNGSKVYT